MGHSMGVRVVLKALKSQSTKIARNVFTMAAAVDNDSIEVGEDFYDATGNSDSVIVFHSKNDRVLKYAYSGAEFDYALGLLGPEDPNDIITHSSPGNPATPSVYVVNCKKRIHAHGAYKRTDQVYTYIAAFLAGSATGQFETL